MQRCVGLYDRAGQLVATLPLPDSDFEYDENLGAVAALEWQAGGRHLVVLPRGQSFAMIYDAETGEVARVDGGVKVRTGGTAYARADVL